MFVLACAFLASWTLWPAPAAVGASGLHFETGQGTALQRVTVPLVIPPNFSAAGLRFDVAFSTDELILAGEFIDSFTLTLHTTNRSHTVTLLTVDRFGATWVPGNPGGLAGPGA